jgi:O-antigen/teichoic acid export membrane protein
VRRLFAKSASPRSDILAIGTGLILGTALQLLSFRLGSSQLSPEGFDEYLLVRRINQSLAPALTIAMPVAIVRRLAGRQMSIAKAFLTGLAVIGAAMLLWTAVVAGFGDRIGDELFDNGRGATLIWVLWAMTVALGVHYLIWSLFDGLLRFWGSAIMAVMTTGLWPVVAVLAFGDRGVSWVLNAQAALIIGGAIAFGAFAIRIARTDYEPLPEAEQQSPASTARFGFSRWLGTLPFALIWLGTQAVVLGEGGNAEGADYAIASTVILLVVLPVRPLTTALLGRVSDIQASGGTATAGVFLGRLLVPLVLVVGTLTAVVIPLISALLELWIGERGASAATASRLLMLGGPGVALFTAFTNGMQSGSEKAYSTRVVWAGLGLLIATVAALRWFDEITAESVSLAVAAAFSLMGFLAVFYTGQLFDIDWELRPFAWLLGTLYALVVGVWSLVIASQLENQNPIVIGLAVGGFALLAIVVGWWRGLYNPLLALLRRQPAAAEAGAESSEEAALST